MADHDDELIARLGAADPVGHQAIRLPDAPEARSFLEELLMSTPHEPFPPAFPPPVGAPATAYLGSPTAPDRSRRARRFAVAAGLAAAAAIAGAVVLVRAGSSPEGETVTRVESVVATPRAAAMAVKKAAATSQEAAVTAVQATIEATVGELTATGSLSVSGADVEATMALTSSGSGPLGAFLPAGRSEFRRVGGATYVKLGDSGWQQVKLPEGMPAAGDLDLWKLDVDGDSLREAFSRLQEITNASQVGAETLDGVEVTHYRGTVTVGGAGHGDAGHGDDHPSSLPAWTTSPVELTVDLWVDGDQLLRRVTASGTLPADAPMIALAGLDGPFSVDVRLAYDPAVTVVAPDDATVVEFPPIPGLGDLGRHGGGSFPGLPMPWPRTTPEHD